MDRKKLQIKVPSLFRCPISMEVMKSPVSLCTGVSYDRSSIQNWLESGHDTCPATMQILPSKHLVPNLTLHRLIHLWLHQHDHSSPRSWSPSSHTTSSQQVRILVDRIEDENNEAHRRAHLAKIVGFARFSEENRRFLADLDGFVEGIVCVFSTNAEMEILEMVIGVLDLIMSQNGVKERVHSYIFSRNYQNYLSKICLVLKNGSLGSKIKSTRILESLALDSESKRRVSEKEDLLSLLIHLLRSENDPDLHDAVLSCLTAVAVIRSVSAHLVRHGLVRVLSESLSNPNTKPFTAEKSLKLLSMVSTCAEGRCAISEESECTAAVVERLTKAGTEDAVLVLWGMCCVHADRKVKEVVVKSNGVTKILLVMQSGCEVHVRKMCTELVKALRVGYKAKEGGLGLGRYETKTTHIMPC